MKTTPYELVFGQPPRESAFPGLSNRQSVMEEDVQDLLEERERDEESESDESDFDYHSDDAQTDQRKQCKIIANERGEILIENFEFYTGHNTII